MRHDPKSFDRSDPDATQALEDALPIVATILSEQAKAEPKDVDLARAHRAYIAELDDQLRGLAIRAGCSVADLRKLACAKVRRAAANPVQAADGFVLPTGRLPGTRGAMVMELALLDRKSLALEAEQRRNLALHRKIAKRASLLRERIFAHGAAGLRGRG